MDGHSNDRDAGRSTGSGLGLFPLAAPISAEQFHAVTESDREGATRDDAGSSWRYKNFISSDDPSGETYRPAGQATR